MTETDKKKKSDKKDKPDKVHAVGGSNEAACQRCAVPSGLPSITVFYKRAASSQRAVLEGLLSRAELGVVVAGEEGQEGKGREEQG